MSPTDGLPKVTDFFCLKLRNRLICPSLAWLDYLQWLVKKTTPLAQILRDARDRERANLRALIAQKRKASFAKGGAAAASGGDEATPDDEVQEWKWSTPDGWAAASPAPPRPKHSDTKVAASEPPRRRQLDTPHGVVPDNRGFIGGVGMRFPAGSSVDAPRRRRRPRSNNEEDTHQATEATEGKGPSPSEAARCAIVVVYLVVARVL